MAVETKYWDKCVQIEDEARKQVARVAELPIVGPHVAVMPDAHSGIGCTVGSVIPTRGAVIPATVGVDLGCGGMAIETSLTASDLPDNLRALRSAIEAAVPHGRTNNGGPGDRGAWGDIPEAVAAAWTGIRNVYSELIDKHPKLGKGNDISHLGTLGTGNHFIEVCLDESDHVWFMLHSGSRGVGNRIGSYFIALAKEDMREHLANLPDVDLAYLSEGTEHFKDYTKAVLWAQVYAALNRALMMRFVVEAATAQLPPFTLSEVAINCHHNYVEREHHFGEWLWVTRKGAVRAGRGDLGIIFGSMGAKSFIVKGKGNPDSFMTCSHGAGRRMSRNAAKKTITLEQHAEAMKGIEARLDEEILDESPSAYKSIDDVMASQTDLVDVVHTLRQVLCVKG